MRSTFKVLFYLKRNKEKTQSVVPLMGRITVNGTISQFSAKLSVRSVCAGGGPRGAVPRAEASKRTVSTGIWTIFALKLTVIIETSATGKAM